MASIEVRKKTKTAAVAIVLKVIGWLAIIGGFVLGILFGQVTLGGYYKYKEFSLALAAIWWASGAVGGILFIGFGKTIELLTIIANKEYVISGYEPVVKQDAVNM